MRNLGEFWRKHWVSIILTLAGALFFWLYLFLYQGLPQTKTLIFNQPDEAANYAFIKEWVLHDQVGIFEPLSAGTLNQVHPRSMTVVEDRLVPIGFPGFIAITATFVRPLTAIFGFDYFNKVVIVLTPLLAVLSSLLLYGIGRSLSLTKMAAAASAFSLLLLPPWWYYASRPLQANTMFTFFVLAGLWAGLRKNSRVSRFFLTGLSFGLALYVRPSEWVWVFGIIILLGIFNREFLKIKTLVAFGLGSGLMVLVFFLTQFAFYGNWLGSGYVRPNSDGSAGLIMAGPQGIYWLKALVLPFGFDGLAILKTLYHYGLRLFLPWTLAAVIGLGFLFANQKKHTLLFKYAVGLVLLGVWLALYYGSWQFSDNLAGQISIGSSQVRYFLPLFVLSLPLIAYLLEIIYSWNWSGKLVVILIGVALAGSSVKSVYFKFEGLVQIKQTVNQYYNWREKVLALTPENAIIVTRYGDKYLFPERKIIATIDTSEGVEAAVQLLRTGAALYWYDLTTGKDQIISGKGLILDKPVASWENLELREIHLIK